MVKWHWNICRRPVRSARYHEVFGKESDYPWSICLLQFVVGGFKCVLYYFLIFLFLKWYIWPIFESSLTKYSLVHTTVNRSSLLIERLRSNRKHLLE